MGFAQVVRARLILSQINTKESRLKEISKIQSKVQGLKYISLVMAMEICLCICSQSLWVLPFHSKEVYNKVLGY